MAVPPVEADTLAPQKARPVPGKRPGRRFVLVIIVLLAVGVAAIWQALLARQPNVPVAGRPLSSSETHLHTVVMSYRPGVVYLGTHFGIFTSTDNGRTWPQARGDLNTTMVTSIAVSPTNPNLLAVLAMPDGNPGSPMGIYVSSDAGQHWRATMPANLPTTTYPYSIQSAAGTGGHFYVFFSFVGWFETSDLGQHWQPITGSSLTEIQAPSLVIDPLNPRHLLLGGDLGLFETSNDGQSWVRNTDVQGAVVSLTAALSNDGKVRTILCATDQGLYRQQGQGAFYLVSGWPASSPPTRVVFHADGTALYAIAGEDLWFSANQGTNWTRYWHFKRSDLISLVIDPANPRILLAGFYWPGLVQISTDAGVSWQTLTD